MTDLSKFGSNDTSFKTSVLSEVVWQLAMGVSPQRNHWLVVPNILANTSILSIVGMDSPSSHFRAAFGETGAPLQRKLNSRDRVVGLKDFLSVRNSTDLAKSVLLVRAV